MQRCMYVLFSRQNTKIGCFIRVFLRNSRYSHVALSLDEKLYTVYSFSRKRHDSPFSGGFMREYPVHYIINAMDVPIKLCRVDMTEEEYAAARARLNDAIERSESMIYNLFDAAALPFGKRYRLKDAYTCVSFTSYVVGMDDVKDIGDLENRLSRNTVFEGGLNELIAKHGLTPARGRPLLRTPRPYCRRRGFLYAGKKADAEEEVRVSSRFTAVKCVLLRKKVKLEPIS